MSDQTPRELFDHWLANAGPRTVEQIPPKPWPEMTRPSVTEFYDWFMACPPDVQTTIVERLLQHDEVAARCMWLDHDARMEQAIRWHQQAMRYRLAWLGARRFRRNFRRAVAEYFAERGLESGDQ